MFRRLLDSWFGKTGLIVSRDVETIQQLRRDFHNHSPDQLRRLCRENPGKLATLASVAVMATRISGLDMFEVQMRGALAMADGKIAEMQTGEGKTLAAVPAVVWHARENQGVHVLTANDYLARRDAAWMGPIYRQFGLSVGCIQQGMDRGQRRQAYSCDITYATANEAGFDYLRDQIALESKEQVHRPFCTALVDEADSILLDEARIPLVIAGGAEEENALIHRADQVARTLRGGLHYEVTGGRNVVLTEAGFPAAEQLFGCHNLTEPEGGATLEALQNALHAHALLRRDVDYLVKDGVVESVDAFKGRIAQDRRWPAGLHTAIEVKEGVARKQQGRILSSITLRNFFALYPVVCGMTGTAASQADEFQRVYSLPVEVIPTNRPVIRLDHPDAVFPTRRQKEQAVLEEIRQAFAASRPVLVGTSSVEESERLSARLPDVPHHVLNARNEEQEASIIAKAGHRGAVTISTNMAGRGVDIQLGPGVKELGGLYVIGMNRHESRRIDLQLRGRAGRQGDPGESRFFVSPEDELMARYSNAENRFDGDAEALQRFVEGQNLGIRMLLDRYEQVVEAQRLQMFERRQRVLSGEEPCADERERLLTLAAMDDLWADYLAAVGELKDGAHWASWGGKDPLREYLFEVHKLFAEWERQLEEELPLVVAQARALDKDPRQRGATWTYLTTDHPLGTLGERIARGLRRKARTRNVWG